MSNFSFDPEDDFSPDFDSEAFSSELINRQKEAFAELNGSFDDWAERNELPEAESHQRDQALETVFKTSEILNAATRKENEQDRIVLVLGSVKIKQETEELILLLESNLISKEDPLLNKLAIPLVTAREDRTRKRPHWAGPAKLPAEFFEIPSAVGLLVTANLKDKVPVHMEPILSEQAFMTSLAHAVQHSLSRRNKHSQGIPFYSTRPASLITELLIETAAQALPVPGGYARGDPSRITLPENMALTGICGIDVPRDGKNCKLRIATDNSTTGLQVVFTMDVALTDAGRLSAEIRQAEILPCPEGDS